MSYLCSGEAQDTPSAPVAALNCAIKTKGRLNL